MESGSRPNATRRALRAALACGALAACTSAERPLRLGTTHTVEQSGALAVLDSLAHPVPATVIGPSGQILAAAARGDLDVVITHAPSLERRLLVEPGHVLLACPFVASRFAIVGPAADPARVAAAARAADAFRRIAAAAGPFVSRGDSSGTHVKELALWDAAGARPPPTGGWYLQAGADQATTLHVADERNAYALADLPTLAKLGGLRLRVLFAADTALTNPYTLYVVRESPRRAAAQAFAQWAMDRARPRILDLRLPDGTPAFVARPGGCTDRL
jgi:tungstate transport system substrate-binding protein